MAVTMPKIDITFVQKATSLISRSERGIAILIVKDDTDKTFTCRQYTDLTAAQDDAESYTADNFAAISDVLAFIQNLCVPDGCGKQCRRLCR